MLTKLLMGVVVVAIDRRLLQRAVHALHLPIRPRMIGFGQAMLNPVFGTDTVKQQREGVAVALPIGELDAIVGQDGMDFVGHSSNEMAQELGSHRSGHPLVQLSEGELGGAVNGDKQVQLAFFGLHFGNVEVKIADGIRLEAAFLRRFVGDFGQAD